MKKHYIPRGEPDPLALFRLRARAGTAHERRHAVIPTTHPVKARRVWAAQPYDPSANHRANNWSRAYNRSNIK